MNSKMILFGGLAAAALIAAGWMLGGDASERTKEPEKGLLFPDFDPNDATAIEVATAATDYRIVRDGEAWGLVEKDDYPVDVGRLRALLLAVDGAEIVDVKTADPALHDRLGLEAEPSEDDAHWRKLSVTNAAGAPIASLILGKRPGSGRSSQAYARRAGEDQCWLVELDAQFSLPPDGTEWIPKEIVKIGRQRVRAARVTHPDGEVVTVSKDDAADAHYRFHELGERTLRYESAPDGLGSSLEYLKLEDVAREDSVDLGDAAPTTVSLWTWDGVRLDVTITPKDDVHWATFTAVADPDGAPRFADDVAGPSPDDGGVVAEADVTPESRQADVDAINAKVEGWLFQLPAYNVTSLGKRAKDMVQAPPSKDEDAEESEFLSPGDGAPAPATDGEDGTATGVDTPGPQGPVTPPAVESGDAQPVDSPPADDTEDADSSPDDGSAR